MAGGKKKGGSGGSGGIIGSIVSLIIIAIILVTFVKVNDIKNFGDVVDFLQNKGDEVGDCAESVDLSTGENTCGDPESKGWWQKGFGGLLGGGEEESNEEAEENQVDPADVKLPEIQESLSVLETIKIAEPKDATYERSDWKHWTGSPCNTREEVLKSQGKNVKTDSDCRATSGEWTDPYSGEVITSASKVDIDHTIPLNWAADNGGQNWDSAKKQAFANDTSHLVATSASVNRSKGNSGPSEWMPENNKCEYAQSWTETASKYGLTMGKKDKSVLEDTLAKCGS